MKWKRWVNLVLPRSILQALLFCVVCGVAMRLNTMVHIQHEIVNIKQAAFKFDLCAGFPLPIIRGQFKDYWEGMNYYFAPRQSILVFAEGTMDNTFDFKNMGVDIAATWLVAIVVAKLVDAAIHRKRVD